MRHSVLIAFVVLSCAGLGTGNDGGQDAGAPTGGGGGGGAGSTDEINCGGGYGGGGALLFPGIFGGHTKWNTGTGALSARSPAIITALQSLGGWGSGDTLLVDFSLAILQADAGTPRQTITAPVEGYCDGGPDCDPLPLQLPLPLGGNVEGSASYTCDTANRDCRLLVLDAPAGLLYEASGATASDGGFTAKGVFVWGTGGYGHELRGDQCISADASGLPVAALLATSDEVAAGRVPHALRFVLPASRMKAGVFVRPATHAGPGSSTLPDAPPQGVRLRLKASFDETPFAPSARVILQALKNQGMILSDSGEVGLSFADDRLSVAKWSALGITAQTFATLRVGDFEVAGLCAEVALTGGCVRAP